MQPVNPVLPLDDGGDGDDDAFLDSLHGIPPEELQRYRGRPLTEMERNDLQARSDTHPPSPRRQGSQRHPPRDTPVSGEDDLMRQIEAGESESRSFRSRWTPSIWNDICAFANAQGGQIWVGVKDDGEIIGAKRDRVDVEIMANIAKEFSGASPRVTVRPVQIRRKELAVIEVAQSEEVIFRSDGSSYRRISGRTVPARDGSSTDRNTAGNDLDSYAEAVSEGVSERVEVEAGHESSDSTPTDDDSRRKSATPGPLENHAASELGIQQHIAVEIVRGEDSASVKSIQRGRGSRYRRSAMNDEIGLNAHEYAAVVAETLRSVADDEPFCFGLFGPWGRGKTFLMDLVEKALPSPDYQFVRFSAWKYRTTPELWVHLYEQLAAGALRTSWLMPLRVGVERRGLWPASAVVGSLALALTPLADKVEWSKWLLTSLGVAGTAFLAGAIFQLRKSGLALKSTYWTMPRHQERLGLQFAVGDDLKAVLCSWLPVARPPGRALWNLMTRRPLELLGYLLAFLGLWFVLQDVAFSLAEWTALSAWIVLLLAAIALGGGLGLLPYLLRVQIKSPRKVVLIVDDLDRCHPNQMLEVIECLQLFLDEDEIRKRLRIVMLVEEEILQNAIIQKYVKSRPAAASKTRAAWEKKKLLQDNLEKLFLLWLRLPALGPEQAGEIVSKATSSLVVHEDDRRNNAVPASTPSDSDFEQPAGAVSKGAPVDNVDESPRIDTTLSVLEQRVLTDAVKELTKGDHASEWGPRSLRSFVFKYQLARMLLNETGNGEFDSRMLVKAMTQQLRGDSPDSDSGIPTALEEVARQVC